MPSDYDTNRTVRMRRLSSTGLMILWHPCEKCGLIDAPFGFEVGQKDKQHKGLGRWFCGACKPGSNDKGEIL
jgi:hypothetical protein